MARLLLKGRLNSVLHCAVLPHPAAVAKPDSGFSAVMCLTWALTKDAVASSSSSSRGGSAAGGQQQLGGPLGGPGFDGTTPGPTSTALLEVAGKARALGTLAAVLSNVAFQLEAEEEHK